MNINQEFTLGDVVHIIIRNPHAQNVAQVQQAAVVQDPNNAEKLSLFLHDTYYPLSDDLAIFTSETEAEEAYEQAFGSPEIDEFYG